MYLKSFKLLSDQKDYEILLSEKRRIFNNCYPFQIFPQKEFENINFKDITIFYGNNGSGKSTLLNIIAEKLMAKRKNPLNKGTYFHLYVDNCQYKMNIEPDEIKIISSDDVFDFLLNMQFINDDVNKRKEELAKQYQHYKYNESAKFINDYEQLKEKISANKDTMSKYVRERIGANNIISQSNGETALTFWQNEIKENSIYILDEPENSLSAVNQLKLKKFIEDSARFYGCQFIISTHSPFLLSLKNAIIYNLDKIPVSIDKWNELESIQTYYNFFKEKEDEFK